MTDTPATATPEAQGQRERERPRFLQATEQVVSFFTYLSDAHTPLAQAAQSLDFVLSVDFPEESRVQAEARLQDAIAECEVPELAEIYRGLYAQPDQQQINQG